MLISKNFYTHIFMTTSIRQRNFKQLLDSMYYSNAQIESWEKRKPGAGEDMKRRLQEAIDSEKKIMQITSKKLQKLISNK